MALKSIPAADAPKGRIMATARTKLRGEPSCRRYSIEFTKAGERAAWDAIYEVTGLRFHLDHLCDSAMDEFSKERGIPKNDIYIDDALAYCCVQLGIDYTKFEHNVEKLDIGDFIAHAKRTFRDWKKAANGIQGSVQRRKLIRLWFEWTNHDDERFEDPDFDAIATEIVKANKPRPRIAPLKLVHSA